MKEITMVKCLTFTVLSKIEIFWIFRNASGNASILFEQTSATYVTVFKNKL